VAEKLNFSACDTIESSKSIVSASAIAADGSCLVLWDNDLNTIKRIGTGFHGTITSHELVSNKDILIQIESFKSQMVQQLNGGNVVASQNGLSNNLTVEEVEEDERNPEPDNEATLSSPFPKFDPRQKNNAIILSQDYLQAFSNVELNFATVLLDVVYSICSTVTSDLSLNKTGNYFEVNILFFFS
jgi:hypothetical protein